jgi:hypothetical protein
MHATRHATMNADERQLALDLLTQSQARLLASVLNLSSQQWQFREDPDRWSIAENIEHLIHFEGFITQAITNALARPAEPDKHAHAIASQSKVASLGSAESRRMPLNAREVVRPTRQSCDPDGLIDEFTRARGRTLAFAAQTDAELHHHFFPHIAFGDLSCYQWLLVLGFHTDRHVLQIRQVQAHGAFPNS